MVGPPPCIITADYTISSHTNIQDSPSLGPFSCPSTGSCTLTIQEGYEVSVAVDVGLSLDLAFKAVEGLTGGLSVDVEITTTTSTEQAGQVQCPTGGAWTCGLLIIPGLVQISGEKTSYSSNPDCGKGPSSLYTVTYPAVTNHLQNMNLSPCARPNFPCSTDAGAPPLCSQDCPQQCVKNHDYDYFLSDNHNHD
ncbi:hypothetical protein NA56DRAFT_694705 [Hyaloscypha hepaticicola]|uniref:Uncharacterized protein n=1 Tax=Hyaloscypha hepaticicola TaxID=2082293 RepID=A0A2J6PHI3_9HELO|nr:hypothetical protein NA56DRAFT_694705 [Hyaloscypha hepaticicola]